MKFLSTSLFQRRSSIPDIFFSCRDARARVCSHLLSSNSSRRISPTETKMSGFELLRWNKLVERNFIWEVTCFHPMIASLLLTLLQPKPLQTYIHPTHRTQSYPISNYSIDQSKFSIGNYTTKMEWGHKKTARGAWITFNKESNLIPETPWTWWKRQAGYGSFVINSPKMRSKAKIQSKILFDFFSFNYFLGNFYRRTMTSSTLWQYPEGLRNQV